jgi:phenylacetate-CoA ligase
MPPMRTVRASAAPPDRAGTPAAPADPMTVPAGLRPLGPFDPWEAFHAGWDVWSGSHADAEGIARRARWRLRDLLTDAAAAPLHARRLRAAAGPSAGDPGKSRLAARRAADVPLRAIEPMSRAELMGHFDESCTDRRVTLADVRAFLADPQRLGEAYLGRYAVWTSSGTTGTPGIYLHDARALAIYDALEMLRLCGLGQPGRGAQMFEDLLRTPFADTHRYAMVGATGGHFAGNASVERLRRLWPWAAANAQVFSILQPLSALVAQLNAYAPSVIATYPTAAELLAQERAAGRLTIHPAELWVGGEQLTDAVRSQVTGAFGCRVREGYGASECLSIAWDCGHGSLHVNADWVILEPVDRSFEPVPAGEPSHTVLLTNLANRVQPMIRYDLGDSVTLRRTPCLCGSAFPAIRVEGRRDESLEFDGAHGLVTLLPLALVTVMEDDAGVFDFQLVARDRHTLVLRLDPLADAHALGRLRAHCRQVLRTYLDAQGLGAVRIADDSEPPTREPVSGKLRRVLRAPVPR